MTALSREDKSIEMNNSNLVLQWRDIEVWKFPTIEFRDAATGPVLLSIFDRIENSVPNGRAQHLQAWKAKIATEVKVTRGSSTWDTTNDYAITLALSFHPANHGNRPLDAENFIKPILDAVAAGLFCESQTDPRNINHWNYDDSNFNTLLIHRLPDADSREKEGIAICVSSRSA